MRDTDPSHGSPDPSENNEPPATHETITGREQDNTYTRAAGSAAVNEAMATPGEVEPRIDRENAIGERVDFAELNELARKGTIVANHHPTLPLTVYNYTSLRTIREEEWTPLLSLCRGLVVEDESGKIIARPFSRMREIESSQELAADEEIRRVYEKVDGTLGIVVRYGDEQFFTTRGNFSSEQSRRATEMLNEILARNPDYQFEPGVTPLFEVVYPEDKKIVDYEGRQDLTLLGQIEISTGRELPLPDPSAVPFSVVQEYRGEGYRSIDDLRASPNPNSEGYIVETDSGKYKVKTDWYKSELGMVHWRDSEQKGTMELRAWRYLSENRTPEDIIAAAPPELQERVTRLVTGLQEKFNEYKRVAESLTNPAIELTDQEKRKLEYVKGKDISTEKDLWDAMRPRKANRSWETSKQQGGLEARVWEHMSRGNSVEQLTDTVPRDLQDHVATVGNQMTARYEAVERRVQESITNPSIELSERELDIRQRMINGEQYRNQVWKEVKSTEVPAAAQQQNRRRRGSRSQNEGRDRNPPEQQGTVQAPNHDEFGRAATVVEPIERGHVVEQEPVLELKTQAHPTQEAGSPDKKSPRIVEQAPREIDVPGPLILSQEEININNAIAIEEARRTQEAAETLRLQQEQALEQDRQRGIEP